MYKFIILAASAALASAYTTPTTQCTDGCNPISKPGLNEVVPAGTAYTVTWLPTTAGTVSLVLLKGPSSNILPVYALAEKIANIGTYTWTPATDLQPTGDSGYGLQIIDDADGTYQWSTQFGISNDAYTGSASASASASGSAYATGTGLPYGGSAGNGTYGSPVTTSASSSPTGYSNGTYVSITTAGSGSGSGSATTLTTSGVSGGTKASGSPSTQSCNGAVALGASFGGAFAAIFAAVAAL